MKLFLVVLLLASASRAFWPFGTEILRPDPLKDMQTLAAQGDYAGAATRTQKAIESQDLRSGERERAYELLGRSLVELGRYDEALGDYQLAVQLYPDAWRLVLAEAQLLQKVGLEQEARPLYERVLSTDRSNAEAHVGLAQTYGHLGLLDAAAKHYRLALAGGLGGDAAAWRQYAHTLADQRDFFNAEQAAQKSISISPAAETWEDKAVYQDHQGKTEQGLDSLAEAQKLHPNDPDLILRRALWLMKLGRVDEAQTLSDAVLAEHPEHGLGLWVRALLKLREGKKEEALRNFWLAEAHGKGFVSKSAAAMAKALQKGTPPPTTTP